MSHDMDLNIRAAKALGWKISTETGDMWRTGTEIVRLPENLPDWFYFENKYIYPVDWMGFTTSYDWAMLGIKECEIKELSFSLSDGEIIIFDEIGDGIYHKIGFRNFPAPTQITEAWVEVLESSHD